MSLLQQTARYLLLTALVIALVGSVGFYALIHRTIQREVDEILTSQLEQTTQRLKQHPPSVHLPADWDDNPHIGRLAGKSAGPLGFVDITNSATSAPIRQLRATVVANGQTYLVVLSQPYYEFNELARIMSAGVIIGFLFLMALSVLVGVGLARRLWHPFYQTIDQLQDFRLDSETEPAFPQSPIREFTLLSRSLRELTQKLRRQFLLQKQFTENASHELQTPLAVAAAELDFLFQSKQLTKTDYSHLQRATDAMRRLSQLNRSLLLLTQVENDQFARGESLSLSELLNRYTDEYEPFFQHKNMMITRSIAPDVSLQMNWQLAGVLLTNLLKNAVRHGTTNGFVRIELTPEALTIQNMGEPLPFAAGQLFNRFIKDPTRPDSVGLGLALVKQICDRYGLSLTYWYDDKLHCHSFQVNF